MKKFISCFLAGVMSLGIVCFSSCTDQSSGGHGNSENSSVDNKNLGEGFYTVDTENKEYVVKEANFTLPQFPEEREGLFTPCGLISDGMVLQRNAVNKIFGMTKEENVAVRIAGETYYGTVTDGRFEIYIDAQEAGGPYQLEIIGKTGKTTVKDVYFGEVFLLSGQSNMAWTMGDSMKGDFGYHTGKYVPTAQNDPATYESYVADSQDRNYEIKQYVIDQLDEAENEFVRVYKIPVVASTSSVYENTEEAENVKGEWLKSDFDSMYNFSAVGCSFGLTLQELIGVPVGLVSAALGATFVPTWTPVETYKANKDSFVYGGERSSDAYNREGRCYGQYIAPIAGYKFRSVIWYQGEGQPSRYAESMTHLIGGWRGAFGYELPFLIVQLPRFGENDTLPNNYVSLGMNAPSLSLFPFESREEQKKIGTLVTKCTYSVNVDLGDYDELHPYDKKTVGQRAAYKVMEYFYQTEGVWSGATVASATSENDGVKLSFDNVGGGLILKNNGINIEVAGADGVYYAAKAELKADNTLFVTSDAVEQIVSVRYGANNYPRLDRNNVSLYMSLFTKDGFPVEQFVINVD